MVTNAPDEFELRYAGSIKEIYLRAGAARWDLPVAAFAASLRESLRGWTAARAAEPSQREAEAYLDALNAADLALATACRLGSSAAWEHFINLYRPALYDAARAITRDEAAARELADSLYAELYGLEQRGGERRSLLAYFHGRSSLRTWLRAVMAQRQVDAGRASRRLEPLDRRVEETIAAENEAADPNRARYVESLGAALTVAMAELAPRDRLRLKLYYSDELTLKEIGRALAEHESSVSRRLARTRKQLHQQVERNLRRAQRLSEEQIRLCYAYAMDAWTAELGRLLSGSP
jgi:RNA polymerase sigma-70 factor (ECF subfamily)